MQGPEDQDLEASAVPCVCGGDRCMGGDARSGAPQKGKPVTWQFSAAAVSRMLPCRMPVRLQAAGCAPAHGRVAAGDPAWSCGRLACSSPGVQEPVHV